MRDQAEGLRNRVRNGNSEKKIAKSIAVISGKGGVGKSNFSLNFSISLSQLGYRVLLFDMDIGMGNIDILLGNSSEKNITDFFSKNLSLQEVISEGPENISIISGGTGLSYVFSMDEAQFVRFSQQLQSVLEQYEYVIFDMGAGISRESSQFVQCVDEIVTITTPEPTSVMDAYSILKYLHTHINETPIYLICNRAHDEKEGKDTISRLQNAIKKFLNTEIHPLGYLPDDRTVSKAVSRQVPFTMMQPNSDISIGIKNMADRYSRNAWNESIKFRKNNFLGRLTHFFAGK
ncbi:MinD/ParA family protein [Peribacillus alkalitolerans]|uniref:MinD/ParA family protein n=1 Tax=Peribacillus alkalitolerans TaxID=1550385 RepID=UPI0013D65C76|nr:MinD/ParA family protein [Peribacillus alkalitolerans]